MNILINFSRTRMLHQESIERNAKQFWCTRKNLRDAMKENHKFLMIAAPKCLIYEHFQTKGEIIA